MCVKFNFLLVTTDEGSDVCVDWNFLECIYQNRNAVPIKVPEEDRKNFKFDPSKYYDAVIMPWYRSQDQPQVYIHLKALIMHCIIKL